MVCEEFSETGKCPRGSVCPLSHHRGKSIRKISVTLERTAGDARKHESCLHSRKRKRSERDVLGGPKVKRKTEKKSRGKKVKSVQPRYFQVIPQTVDTNEPEKLLDVPASIDVQDVEKRNSKSTPQEIVIDKGSSLKDCQLYHSNDVTPVENETTVSEGIKEEAVDQQNSMADTNHNSTSNFNEVKQRVLEKIDKMKSFYSTFEEMNHEEGESANKDNTEEIHDIRTVRNTASTLLVDSPGECNNTNVENSPESSMDILCEEPSRLQRPPLPKHLPSYIPLTMD